MPTSPSTAYRCPGLGLYPLARLRRSGWVMSAQAASSTCDTPQRQAPFAHSLADQEGAPGLGAIVCLYRESGADISCGAQDSGDVVDCVELAGGDLDHQIVGGVVGKRETASVEAVEGDERAQRELLVAVHQSMTSGQRVPIVVALPRLRKTPG
jgi:hypothetical protein